MKHVLLFSLFIISFGTFSNTLKGKVQDDEKLPLIGATIQLVELHQFTTTGMDGSFQFLDVIPGKYTLKISYIGFTDYSEPIEIIANSIQKLTIQLQLDVTTLKEFEVTKKSDGSTIAGSRIKEKNSALVMNVTSAEAIALSPDNSVAEVVQRISGVTMENNPSGTGESFAIIRGMPKRYNYTLVNGIKIPSSDNKNRYISLDLFPSDLLERVEVVKSLTPNMEGDAVGGAINMVMRNAPKKTTILANAFIGYHPILFNQAFQNFDAKAIDPTSPFQKNGPSYKATIADFTTKNLESNEKHFAPDYYLSLGYGKRFLHDKLGVLISGTANKLHTGTEAVRFEPSTTRDGTSLPVLTNMSERFYFNDITQFGLNAAVDYQLSKKHNFKLSSVFLDLNNNQLRNQTETRLWGISAGDNPVETTSQRFRKTHQRIYNFTLAGTHEFSNKWTADWKAAYSKAKRERPDHADFVTVNNYSLVADEKSILVAEDGDNNRAWEYNTDTDFTGILNLSYTLKTNKSTYMFKTGGLFRLKNRNSFIVSYNFNPDPGIQAYGNNWQPDDEDITQYGTWEHYGDIQFRVRNPQGSTRNELNQDSHQNVAAIYGMIDANFSKIWHAIAGARMEFTDQGYELLAPRAGQETENNQTYWDVLPSFALKYALNSKSNLRISYFYSIIRPSYFEIVPYLYREEDYIEMGNPDLQKIRTHNLDIRYELFTKGTGQFLIGAFYKQINDPIEYVLTDGTDLGVNDIVRRPQNFGTAVNYGIEVNFIKYVRNFGMKLNYSYTHSEVTTEKSQRQREDPADNSSNIITVNIDQTRPLQGQAAHIGNFSLLYKGVENGMNAQLAFNYTGERIRTVSNFYNNDEWEKPFYQLDLSVEKQLNKKWQMYLKVRNLLNAKYQTFIKQPINEENADFPYQEETGDYVITGQQQIGSSFRLGFRYKM